MKKIVLIILTFVSFAAYSQENTCASLLTTQDAKAWHELPGLTPATDLDVEKQGSTGGKWYRDSKGKAWFVKKDAYYNELQTSAEVIGAKIYGALGYRVPIIEKIIVDGVHYIKVSEVQNIVGNTRFEGMDEPSIRNLRVIAAFLADYDRVGNRANNLLEGLSVVLASDETRLEVIPGDKRSSFTLIDFGGALGSKARGKHKDGELISDAVGAFSTDESIFDIMSSVPMQRFTKDRETRKIIVIPLVEDHPWRKLNMEDAQNLIGKLENRITNGFIREVVRSAQYSSRLDQEYIISALIQRRDTIIEGLESYMLSLDSRGEVSYARLHRKTDALEVEAMDIPEDQKIEIYRIQAKENNNPYREPFYRRLGKLKINVNLRKELLLSSIETDSLSIYAISDMPKVEVTNDLIQAVFNKIQERIWTNFFLSAQEGLEFRADLTKNLLEELRRRHDIEYEAVDKTSGQIYIKVQPYNGADKFNWLDGFKGSILNDDLSGISDLIARGQVTLQQVGN